MLSYNLKRVIAIQGCVRLRRADLRRHPAGHGSALAATPRRTASQTRLLCMFRAVHDAYEPAAAYDASRPRAAISIVCQEKSSHQPSNENALPDWRTTQLPMPFFGCCRSRFRWLTIFGRRRRAVWKSPCRTTRGHWTSPTARWASEPRHLCHLLRRRQRASAGHRPHRPSRRERRSLQPAGAGEREGRADAVTCGA
jgi:hypothetical protein